jgi:CheY-like chemotaxis protein
MREGISEGQRHEGCSFKHDVSVRYTRTGANAYDVTIKSGTQTITGQATFDPATGALTGLTGLTANTGAAAVDAGLTTLSFTPATGAPFDIAFCDIHMPGFTGLQVLDALRGDGALASTPICLVTTLGHESDIERGLARGAAAYLTKPVDFGAVLAVLHKYCPARRNFSGA